MATNFPDSPTIDDIYTVDGRSWKWDGTVWNADTSAASGGGSITVTDELPGDTLYVGDTTPTTPVEGDVWIDESSVTGAITWGQLKALAGIASGG